MRAISELESLSPDNPLKSDTLDLLYNMRRNLEASSKTTQEDREFIMRLAPLYQQEREQTLQQGLQQGLEQGLQQGRQEGRQEEASSLVLRQLERRFGEISQNLAKNIQGLSVERLENLGVALLDFQEISDLLSWLEQSGSSPSTLN